MIEFKIERELNRIRLTVLKNELYDKFQGVLDTFYRDHNKTGLLISLNEETEIMVHSRFSGGIIKLGPPGSHYEIPLIDPEDAIYFTKSIPVAIAAWVEYFKEFLIPDEEIYKF